MTTKQYPEKWQRRFDFFDAYGSGSKPGHRTAMKQLAFMDRMNISMNFYALIPVFGLIYMIYLGLWRKALTIVAASLLLIVAIFFVTGGKIAMGLMVVWLMCATFTNGAYYLQEMRGDKGWNPFKSFPPKDSA